MNPLGALPVAGLLLVPVAPAAADTPEPASVQLPQCSPGSALGETRVPDCSYIALPAKSGGAYYGYLTSPGPVSWAGTHTGDALTFPASGQRWTTLSLFGGLGKVSVAPATVTGTLTAEGQVQVTLPFEARVEALGQQCIAKGLVTISTSGTDLVGGGVGTALDPTSKRFAAAGSSTTAPQLAGSACAQAVDYLDTSRGVGVFLSGYLTVGGSSSGASAGAQTAAFTTPKTLKRKGTTVVLKKAVTTNAGQKAIASLTWSTKKGANGTSARLATAKVTKSGRVTLTTTGKAKRLHVRLTLSAPPAPGYNDYLVLRKWVVR